MTQRELYQKIINYIMKDGNKSKAIKLINESLNLINLKMLHTDLSPWFILITAIENIQPYYQLKSIKAHGKNLLVPFPISKQKQFSLASKLIISTARKSSISNEIRNFFEVISHFNSFSIKFAYEIISTYNKTSGLYKNRLNTLEQAISSFNQLPIPSDKSSEDIPLQDDNINSSNYLLNQFDYNNNENVEIIDNHPSIKL